MKYSKNFITTQKSSPKDLETPGAQLLAQAGFIHKVSSGIFSFAPLGTKVIQNIVSLICEKFADQGVEEVILPVLQPAILWQNSGRLEKIDETLWRLKNRAKEEFVLSMTAEEVITNLVSKNFHSYKDFPKILNQFGVKIRDELRPKSGLLRTREFLMQDAYSFDISSEEADKSFQKIVEAYRKIFAELGLDILEVKADVGEMGGKESMEFSIKNQYGEDRIIYCEKCKYSASEDQAESLNITSDELTNKVRKKEKKITKTPQISSVEEVAEFLRVSPKNILKTVAYYSPKTKKVILSLIRGDLQINQQKLANILSDSTIRKADDNDLEKAGLVAGYFSPIGANAKVETIADSSVKFMINFIAGANLRDAHYVDMNLSDLKIDKWAEISAAREGHRCAKCGSPLKIVTAIELGHAFKLGTYYSKSMGAKFLDQQNQEKYLEMGCYGIGISRLMQTCVEVFHDEKGIIWPERIAPAHVHLMDISESPIGKKTADDLYQEFEKAGVSVIYDDRDCSPGNKFADSDLIGCPYRVMFSKRTLDKTSVEIKNRKSQKEELVKLDKVIEYFKK